MSVHVKTADKKTATIGGAQKTNKKWRESRFALAIEIEVSGIDGAGRPFIEQTKTEDVSEWGCRFLLSRSLDRHAPVALRTVGQHTVCLAASGPVMYIVARAKQERESWLIGVSKIQAEKLWDLSALPGPGAERGGDPPAPYDKNAAQYMAIETLGEAELDALSYGAIQVDGTGKILRYNRFESDFSGLDKTSVIGKNFFTEVAPCTAVREFFGRFHEAVQKKTPRETFAFEFPFRTGARRVAITLLHSNRTDTVWIFVQPLQAEHI